MENFMKNFQVESYPINQIEEKILKSDKIIIFFRRTISIY